MNIAIIIGVSEYDDQRNNLPGCKIDARSIHEIMQKSGKYDHTLYINEKLSSASIKDKLTEFVSEHKNKEVDELVFYYTGHGEFWNDEFYFQLSDFNEAKRKQTTLQNNEVDTFIKAIGPELVVKIIDACQSGKSYIKEANSIEKYFKETGNKFKKCYFLNSSLNDQSSYQTDVISDFTSSFIRSIKEHGSKEIRYKDVIDYISDEFENSSTQTPYFVTQADFTEKFCSITPALREYLEKLSFEGESTAKGGKAEELSLIDKVKKQAEKYSSKDSALKLIKDLGDFIMSIECPEDLRELFNTEINFFDDYSKTIKKNSIGKWLDDNDHEYFAKSKYTKVRKDKSSNPFSTFGTQSLILHSGAESNFEYEWVPNGFESEVELPYKTIIFDLNSKYPNIDSYSSRIIYFLSKRQIIFFYLVTNYEEKNWDERRLNTDVEWFYSEHSITIKEEIENGITKIFDKLIARVRKDLEDAFSTNED
jgi:hypothetical protein